MKLKKEKSRDLFDHAQNLGLDGVWIYGYRTSDNPPIPVAHYNNQFENISTAAYTHGFLKRFCRKWQNSYKCTNPNGTRMMPPGDDWVYLSTFPTTEISER